MPDINILSPHVADLIAAGEVVEHPASVIKELLENSFDAGAKNVTIEIKDGGMTYIRITDDGCGMLPEDAGICFQRHATSKLHDERGLEAIGTMGFRGEALAAIASVSDIELRTRKRDAAEGCRVTVSAGDIDDIVPCGCPEGTTFTVRSLFRNTPARLKFMKSDRAESGACIGLALRCALGRPEVSVRFLRDGKEEFFSPGDGKLASACYCLLGRDIAADMLEIGSEDEYVSVSGFVGSPKAGHGNRAKQFFFVNGRCIRSALLQSAVEQAYKNTLLTGRYPAAVVQLKLSPAAVDVNVHPAKTEVKFRDEKRVFDAVYYAARSALEGEGKTADIKLSPSTAKAVSAPKKDFFQSMPAQEFKQKYSETPKAAFVSYTPPKPVSAPAAKSAAPAPKSSSPCGTKTYPTPRFNDSAKISYAPETFAPAPAKVAAPPKEKGAEAPVQTSLEAAKPAQTVLESSAPAYRLIGEAMKTYILVESGDKLILIDKHAAHERMIFDRLKKEGRELMSQGLLTPVTLRLSGEDMELLEKNAPLLSSLGFELEPFGDDSVILRGVPADTAAADAPAMIEEICEKLRGGKGISVTERVDEILHTVACKAAIKAGWSTTAQELATIADAVITGDVKYCPHGRPVSFALSRKELDKEFSRIV